jgi:murein DD-endopeptidase MepM/ murein hydrolase activator NlpD
MVRASRRTHRYDRAFVPSPLQAPATRSWRRVARLPPRPFFVCGLLIVCAVWAAGSEVSRAGLADNRRHELQHRLADTRARIAEARRREGSLAAEIAEESARIDGVEARLDDLGAVLAAREARLGRSRARLAWLENELARKVDELMTARQQLAIARERVERRLVEIYTSGEPAVLEILLGSESLEELIDGVETRERVLAQDTAVARQVSDLRSRLARERARLARLEREQARQTDALAEQTKAARSAFVAVVTQRNRLSALRADRRRSLAAVRVRRNEWEAEAAALAAESAKVASLLTAERSPMGPSPAAGVTATSVPSSSGFVWPVQGAVVSPYGERWGRLHAGVDIAAPAGTPIVASAAGVVVFAGSMGGYGLIVVIQHAGGLATAYAHNSSIAVSAGQSVAQGETIAAVGCTGRCFGDHVHFEVRAAGNPVDPMAYL